MNPFLKEFKSKSNEDLLHKITVNSEVKEKFVQYEKSLNSYHDNLINNQTLSNSNVMKDYFTQNNFHALTEPKLILLNPQYKPIAMIDLDLSHDNWISPVTASKIIGTAYAVAAVIHVPSSHPASNNIPFQEIEKAFALMDIHLIDTIISSNKEVLSFSEERINRWTPQNSWSLNYDSEALQLEFIKPEIFNSSANYLTGYHEFKQHQTEVKIQGLHINNDSVRIKGILIDAYKTQPFETANIICFDKNGFVNGLERISAGTATRTAVYPSEVIKKTIEYDAAAFALVHNHPSGAAEPSDADIALTRHMRKIANLVGRPIIDHYIVASNDICSFVELNLLEEYRGFEDHELER